MVVHGTSPIDRPGREVAAGAGKARVIRVTVKPGARVSRLEETSAGVWLAQLKSPPIDGKANAELIALLAEYFACRKSAVSIKSGVSGRVKLVRIEEG